jgi:hypothetical protein
MSIIFAFFTGPLMQALAKTREVAILEWSRTTVGVLLIVGAGILARGHSVNWQIMAMALARFANGVFLVTPVFLYILMRLCQISFRELLFAVTPAFLSSASVVGAITLVQYFSPATNKPVFSLVAEVTIGAIVGLPVLLHFDKPLGDFFASSLRRAFRPTLIPSGAE